MMKNIFFKTVITGFIFSGTLFAQVGIDLLKASDRARGSIDGGLTWESEVTTVEDSETSVRKFKVRAKGVNANVEALEPSRNKGEMYLFNDRTMWFFKPALKKPVAISSKINGPSGYWRYRVNTLCA